MPPRIQFRLRSPLEHRRAQLRDAQRRWRERNPERVRDYAHEYVHRPEVKERKHLTLQAWRERQRERERLRAHYETQALPAGLVATEKAVTIMNGRQKTFLVVTGIFLVVGTLYAFMSNTVSHDFRRLNFHDSHGNAYIVLNHFGAL